MVKIKTYKVFSSLLMYPTKEFKDDIDCVYELLLKDGLLLEKQLNKLVVFIDYIKNTDLLVLQEYYVSIFDRQKGFSLYLFEHIHGDSRERGMAMVDLKNLYKLSAVDTLRSKELPDYIPVFLEYLSLLSKKQASILLGEIINIVSVIKMRLQLCNSLYFVIFDLVESLSCISSDKKIVNNMMSCKMEMKLDVFSIDKEWEEPKVF